MGKADAIYEQCSSTKHDVILRKTANIVKQGPSKSEIPTPTKNNLSFTKVLNISQSSSPLFPFSPL